MDYITDKSLVNDRQGDEMEERKKTVREKWSVSTDRASTCGNIMVYFKNNKAALAGMFDTSYESTWSYAQISSALALYRTISLFECGLDARQVDFYKMNWFIQLEHKETKQILALGEWKGGFQIFTTFDRIEQLAAFPTFKADAEELLTLLVSPTMTIGYDGTVAGTVA